MSATFDFGVPERITMRRQCQRCGHTEGYVVHKNGQAVVYCLGCNSYAYCRPKAEAEADARLKALENRT